MLNLIDVFANRYVEDHGLQVMHPLVELVFLLLEPVSYPEQLGLGRLQFRGVQPVEAGRQIGVAGAALRLSYCQQSWFGSSVHWGTHPPLSLLFGRAAERHRDSHRILDLDFAVLVEDSAPGGHL
jgi:hypothetical protein